MEKYQKKVGRFTIEIEPDYDAPYSNPNDWGNGYLLADDRNFYTLSHGEDFYQRVYDLVQDDYKIYPIYWNLYSSAQNPVLRRVENCISYETLRDDNRDKVVILARNKTEAKEILEDWKHYFEDSYYEYLIKDEDGEVVESCGGYQESSYKIEETYCYKEALELAQSLEKEAKKEDRKIKGEALKGSITMDTTLSEMLLSDNNQVKRLAKGIYKEIQK